MDNRVFWKRSGGGAFISCMKGNRYSSLNIASVGSVENLKKKFSLPKTIELTSLTNVARVCSAVRSTVES